MVVVCSSEALSWKRSFDNCAVYIANMWAMPNTETYACQGKEQHNIKKLKKHRFSIIEISLQVLRRHFLYYDLSLY